MTEAKLKQQVELLNQRLDEQLKIVQCLQETVAMQMQSIISLENEILNSNSYTVFLMNQLALVANGQQVPELHAAMQSYHTFKKDVKTH